MKNLFSGNIPWSARLAVLGLAVSAGIVAGRDNAGDPEAAAAAKPSVSESSAAPESGRDVDISIRQRGEQTDKDLFAPPTPKAATPPPAPPPPPVAAEPIAPKVEVRSAPPLPFAYLGQLESRQTTLVFLLKGDEILVLAEGDVIENTYKIEGISEATVDLVYLPLGLKQSLAIPQTP